jgi:hypothetical protein
MTKKLIILLAIIAAVVFIGITLGMNMWLLICLYWIVLTIKNVLDAKGDGE